MSEFNHRKWFKNQYLEEANIKEERMSKEDAFKALRDIEANMEGKIDAHYIQLMGLALDHLQAAEITAMMDRERSLKEDDIEENRLYPEAAYFDNIIKLIKSETMKHGGSEIDEAMDVMKFIGQHYGINFEFGRG